MDDKKQLPELDYEQHEQLIRELPKTWTPALLLLMIRNAYANKVFLPGKATQFISDNIPGEVVASMAAQLAELEKRLSNYRTFCVGTLGIGGGFAEKIEEQGTDATAKISFELYTKPKK